MNKIFKEDKVIRLDEFYHLKTDGGNGIQLVFEETRTRKKKDSEETEEFLYTESLFFTRIAQSLNRYVELTQNRSKDLKELIEVTSKIYAVISEFDIKYKQFE